MTSYWNDTPTAPPTTDTDPCASWTSDGPASHTHQSPAAAAPPHAAQPTIGAAEPSPQLSAPMPPPPPPRTSLPSPSRGSGARVALVALIMVGLVSIGYVGRGLVDDTTPVPASSRNAAASTTPSTNGQPSTPLLPGNDEEPVKAVAKALGPSVVVISAGQSLGSGVIYDTSGLIITNAHVVGNATDVTVTLNDGRRHRGTVLGADAPTDIAVVRVDGVSGLSAARLAGQSPEVGDLVVALGSPFGLDQTITSGVVSAVNRPVNSGNGITENMIQTDAAINPGNSGGALANRRAEVIGINSQIYSQSGDNSGIGFAIPIARAKQVADRLLKGESVDRAYLGVTSKAADDGAAGAQVATVQPGTAAEQAGLQPGDVITAVNGTPVKDPTDLAGAIAANEPGSTVTLTVERDGRQTDLQATLGVAEAQATANPPSRGQTPRTLN